MPAPEPPNIKKLQKNGDVSGLIAVATDMEDRNIRLAAVEALGEIGEPAVPALIKSLYEPLKFKNLGRAIKEALVKIGTPAVDLLLTELQGDRDREAAEVLGEIGDSRAVQPLITMLNHEQKFRRPPAAKALGQIGDNRAIQPLIAMLNDEFQSMREAAIEALGHFDDPQAREALAPYVIEEDVYDEIGPLARYRLQRTSLNNLLDLEVKTEKYCVYCKHLRNPNLLHPDYSKGAGDCNNWGHSGKDLVSFDETCIHWKPNTKVRFWLSKGYMEHNPEGWPRKPWYQVFDDGPDGEKGTH